MTGAFASPPASNVGDWRGLKGRRHPGSRAAPLGPGLARPEEWGIAPTSLVALTVAGTATVLVAAAFYHAIEKPFLVRSIWHDGQFTYIKADASELPALYEVKDGKPSLVNFQVQHGTYVVPKVVDEGYLALGKARLTFAQQEQ